MKKVTIGKGVHFYVFYPLLFLLFCSSQQICGNEKNNYRYQLSVCSIFRDEARFLKEWIEFHRMVGVEHFYLYNHMSEDDYNQILQPYIEEGIVELFDWPTGPDVLVRNIQAAVYTNCVNVCRNETKWLAVIDVDEFLYAVNQDDLVQELKTYQEFGGVCVNWQEFGTSGVKRIPDDRLLIEMLLMKADYDHWRNQEYKSVVRPDRVKSFENAHFANYRLPYFHVNEQKERIKAFWLSPYVTVEKLRINHYWSRDEDFFYNTKIARRLKVGDGIDGILERNEMLNHEPDDVILRFVPELTRRFFSSE